LVFTLPPRVEWPAPGDDSRSPHETHYSNLPSTGLQLDGRRHPAGAAGFVTGLVPPDDRVTVVVPAFNEEAALGAVLEDLKRTCGDLVAETIVVDDGSTDTTAHIAAGAGVTVVRHPVNLGYGAALKSGLRRAQTPIVVTMDADGQHRAADVIRLVAAASDADMIVGARVDDSHAPLWRRPGKWLLSAMANYLSRRDIPDLNSGLRLMRRDVALKYLHLCPAGFSFSTTMTLALASRGWRIRYVPIEAARRIGHSTVSVATGLETMVLILRLVALFDPLRVFVPASALIAAIGVLWGAPYALMGRGVSVGSLLAMVTALLLFGLGLLCDQISQLRLERYE
jgi:glycosyltransferase involved in cell wall biosynthesis